jgi:hypothetical protein
VNAHAVSLKLRLSTTILDKNFQTACIPAFFSYFHAQVNLKRGFRMAEDQELVAMGRILEAMEKLGPDEKLRVLNWAAQKFSIELRLLPDREVIKRSTSGASEQSFEHSTDTIATALGAKSGSDVVIAAAAHLHFVRGKQKFTRQELTSEMRTAPAHFKETFVNNLTSYLTGLTRSDRLRLVSTDTYAISSKERQELTKVLEGL